MWNQEFKFSNSTNSSLGMNAYTSNFSTSKHLLFLIELLPAIEHITWTNNFTAIFQNQPNHTKTLFLNPLSTIIYIPFSNLFKKSALRDNQFVTCSASSRTQHIQAILGYCNEVDRKCNSLLIRKTHCDVIHKTDP